MDIDLTNADVRWLHANHGVDLTGLRLSPIGPSLVIVKRKEAIPFIAGQLLIERADATAVADMLDNIYTDKSISPLSGSQDSVFVSAGLIQELDDSLTREQAEGLLQAIRQIALRGGFTVDTGGAAG